MHPVVNGFSEPAELCIEHTEVAWQVLVNEELALDLVPYSGLTKGTGSLSTDFSKIEVTQCYFVCCSLQIYYSWNKMCDGEQNTEIGWVLPSVLHG